MHCWNRCVGDAHQPGTNDCPLLSCRTVSAAGCRGILAALGDALMAMAFPRLSCVWLAVKTKGGGCGGWGWGAAGSMQHAVSLGWFRLRDVCLARTVAAATCSVHVGSQQLSYGVTCIALWLRMPSFAFPQTGCCLRASLGQRDRQHHGRHQRQ